MKILKANVRKLLKHDFEKLCRKFSLHFENNLRKCIFENSEVILKAIFGKF